MSGASNIKNIVFEKNKADILRTLCYLDVFAHLLSRGVISMPEHRQILALPDDVSRVNKLLDIISDRQNSTKHLIDGMNDYGKYTKLIRSMQTKDIESK